MCQALLYSLKCFYQDKGNVEVLSSVVLGTSPVSLKLVQWYVSTRLAKGARIDHDNMLRAYTKRFFDPFRRSNHVVLDYSDVTFETTIGQMNFFRWMIIEGHWDDVIRSCDTLIKEAASAPKSVAVKKARKAGKLVPWAQGRPDSNILQF